MLGPVTMPRVSQRLRRTRSLYTLDLPGWPASGGLTVGQSDPASLWPSLRRRRRPWRSLLRSPKRRRITFFTLQFPQFLISDLPTAHLFRSPPSVTPPTCSMQDCRIPLLRLTPLCPGFSLSGSRKYSPDAVDVVGGVSSRF